MAVKRISKKKYYKIEFFNENNYATAVKTGLCNIFTCALAAREVCSFIPKEMKITDIETNEFIFYNLRLEPYNAHEKQYYGNEL